MPSAVTDWGTSEFLSICLGLISPPARFYVALTSDEPGTDIDGDAIADMEPDPAANYNRIPIPLSASYWSSPDGAGFSTNLNPVVFDNPTTDWGVLNHFALCNQNTSGEVFLYGEFDIAQQIGIGQPLVIPAGGLIVGFGSLSPSIVAL